MSARSLRATSLYAGACMGAGVVAYSALPPLLPEYVRRFGLSTSQAGVLSAAFAVGVLAASVPAGVGSARNVRAAIVGGLAAIAAGTLLMSAADSLWLVGVARIAQGVGHAFAVTGALALLFARAPSARRTEALGRAEAVAIVGALLGPVVGALASGAGPGPVFGAAAVLTVAIAVAVALGVSERASGERRAGTPVAGMRRLVRPGLLAPVALLALQSVLLGMVSVVGPLRLDDAGVGAGGVAAVFLTAAASGFVLFPLVGRATDRRGRRALLVATLALAALASLAFLLAHGRVALALGTIAAWVAYNVIAIPAVALLGSRGEEAGAAPALTMAIVSLIWAAFSIAGAAGGGVVFERAGATVPTLLAAAVCAAGAAVGCTGAARR